MSLQIDIKSGDQVIGSITSLGGVVLNTLEKFVEEYVTVEAVHDTEDATANPADIKQGVTAYTANGKVAGAMATYNWTSYDSIPVIVDQFTIPSEATSFEVIYG